MPSFSISVSCSGCPPPGALPTVTTFSTLVFFPQASDSLGIEGKGLQHPQPSPCCLLSLLPARGKSGLGVSSLVVTRVSFYPLLCPPLVTVPVSILPLKAIGPSVQPSLGTHPSPFLVLAFPFCFCGEEAWGGVAGALALPATFSHSSLLCPIVQPMFQGLTLPAPTSHIDCRIPVFPSVPQSGPGGCLGRQGEGAPALQLVLALAFSRMGLGTLALTSSASPVPIKLGLDNVLCRGFRDPFNSR